MDGDDLLLERLRYRARHPALRFDCAFVPEEWLTRHYGELTVREFGCRRGDAVEVPADSRYAREFFADTPNRAENGPATGRQVAEAERAIGRRLPDLLRRLYLEVADGGFGPGDNGGFASINARHGDSSRDEWSAVEMCLDQREWGLPDTWFPLAIDGCNMYWYVNLDEPGNPVHHFDWDGWDWRPDDPGIPPEMVRPIEVGIVETTPTLAEWLWHWAEGGHIVRPAP